MISNEIFLGIEIGGTKLQLVTGTADGVVSSQHRFEINKEDGAGGIRRKIHETVLANFKQKITAAGIGFGGPVNWKTGQIAASFHIEGWSDFNMAEWLEPIIEAPVFIENDANVAALGESVLGAGKDYRIVLYITVGSGVGGGLIIDRQIYHGAIPGEIEIGHLRLDRSGDSLQSRCSGWAIDEKIRKAIVHEPRGLLAGLVGVRTRGEAIFLKQALEENDPLAWQIFNDTTDDLAFGISHAVHLLHPEIVILGGGFSLTGEILRKTLEKKIPGYLMKAFQPGPVIALAQLKEQSVPIGSLLLAQYRFQHAKQANRGEII